MIRTTIVAIVVCWSAQLAHADRAAVADTANRLSTTTAALAKSAKASDDRGVRKKFAPPATDLADDLAGFARRVGKDVPVKTLAKDASELDRQALALVELADEADDKDERKALRAQATTIELGVAAMRKLIDGVGDDHPAAPAAKHATGRLMNTTDKCDWPNNVKFVVSRDGQVVFASQLVFPGKEQGLVVEQGSYYIQVLDTTNKQLAAKKLDIRADGWAMSTGCVNAD